MADFIPQSYPERDGVQLPNYTLADFDSANQAFMVLSDLATTLLIDANNKLVRLGIQQIIIFNMMGSELEKWAASILPHIIAINDLISAHYPNPEDPVLIAMLDAARTSQTELQYLYDRYCRFQ